MTGLTIPKMVESRAFSQHKLLLENPCWTITFALIYLWKWPERMRYKYTHTHTLQRPSERNEMKFIMLSDQSLGLDGKAENEIVGNKRERSFTGWRRWPVGNISAIKWSLTRIWTRTNWRKNIFRKTCRKRLSFLDWRTDHFSAGDLIFRLSVPRFRVKSCKFMFKFPLNLCLNFILNFHQ